jgi:hypothetical protein
MSRKRVPPEAQIIALFSGLSELDKKMVLFGLNAIMAMSVPKSTAPAVEKKSSRRSATVASIASTEAETGNASTVEGKGDLCLMCGYEASYQDHFKPSPNYHAFEGKKKASAA